MHCKAISSLDAAKILFQQKNFNGAANRAYYALYQALVFFWEETLGRRAEEVDSFAKQKHDIGEVASWRHSWIIKNLSPMKLSTDQESLIQTAWSLRVKADYSRGDVLDEVEEIIQGVPAILALLKVPI